MFLTRPMNVEEKQIKDPLQEIAHYRHEALRATGEGRDLLTLCWRLTMDAAQNFSRQCEANKILSPQDPLFVKELASLIQENQEAKYRLNNSPAPSSFLTPRWIFSINELKEAAACYRTWMVYTQAKSSHYLQQEILQTTEAITKYQQAVPKVAFFAQEARNCFQRAQKIQRHSSTEPLLARELTLYRWRIAAYAAVRAAAIHLHLQAIASWNNAILVHHWNEAANLAEHAFYFRIKAAEVTQQGDEVTAMHWSLAAYAANNSSDIHVKLLELFPLGDEHLITCWTEAFHLAEEVMKTRKEAALACEKKRKHLELAAFWKEHCYECSMQLLMASPKKCNHLEEGWNQVLTETKNFLTQWKPIGEKSIFQKCFPEAMRQENRLRKKIRKKTLDLVVQDFPLSFFTMEEPFLDEKKSSSKPDPEVQHETSYNWIRRSSKLVPEVKYGTFHSWISQTWKIFQQANIRCQLVEDPHIKGVIILMADMVKFSWGADKIAPRDLFLVDVVADGLPSPQAHFYILQNRSYARFFPRSFFMPHWPQPSLIPRDPARNTRFEHICFFGVAANFASELQSQTWTQRLKKELGIVFTIRPASQWHDYRDVDGVIAIRQFPSVRHFHKPATKLYNAWLAGVPFIGGCDSAYAADGHPGKDYLVATSPEEVFQHLKRLKEDLPFREMLVQNGHRAGASFSKEATLAEWKKLIDEVLPPLVLRWHKKSRWGRYWFFQTQRLLCCIDTYVKKVERLQLNK